MFYKRHFDDFISCRYIAIYLVAAILNLQNTRKIRKIHSASGLKIKVYALKMLCMNFGAFVRRVTIIYLSDLTT